LLVHGAVGGPGTVAHGDHHYIVVLGRRQRAAGFTATPAMHHAELAFVQLIVTVVAPGFVDIATVCPVVPPSFWLTCWVWPSPTATTLQHVLQSISTTTSFGAAETSTEGVDAVPSVKPLLVAGVPTGVP